MDTSVFGVAHQISKADVGDALKAAHAAGEHAKAAVKACPKCGPGSARKRMSMRAWESQTASHTKPKEVIQTMGGNS